MRNERRRINAAVDLCERRDDMPLSDLERVGAKTQLVWAELIAEGIACGARWQNAFDTALECANYHAKIPSSTAMSFEGAEYV
jgi:hypothetical protein